MATSTLTRTPSWESTRRQLQQLLTNLQKHTNISHLKQLHAQIYKSNLFNDQFVIPKLIISYSHSHHINYSINTFNQVQYPNLHLYNTLIRAFTINLKPYHAFNAFVTMQKDSIFGDNFTYPFLLKACSGLNLIVLVQMLHAHIEKLGFLGDIFVPNSLIDSYCKCGFVGLDYARRVFLFMVDRDVVSWNSMICGLVRGGRLGDARQLFDEMPERDVVSWNTILDGYVKAGDVNVAFELFERMPERNVVSWSSMVLGYVKVGDMVMARSLFDKMPVKNLVSWTIIISGYAEKGFAKEAIELYDQMEDMGLKPDDGTVVSILAACAESGLLGLGKRVHDSIRNTRSRCSVIATNALIDMYAKCGSLNKALNLFEEMGKRDLVSWNAIIQGLAMHGHGDTALRLFSRMKQDGFQPDKVTLIGVLCACTHMGFVDKGVEYFYTMEKDYGIIPEIEHYGCLIDLLGRGGRLKEALNVVQTMPMEPNAVIWGTLLGACRMHNAVELAGEVQKHLVQLEPTDAGNFSMLSNIYAAAGDWVNVANMRQSMKGTGVQKPAGASSIELNGEVHEFTAFDNSHPRSKSIYQMINILLPQLKKAGYVPRAG